MSDRRRRWSPESSRRRRKAKRDSREQLVLDDPSMAPPDSRSVAPPTATESTFTSSYSHAYPGGAQSQGPSSSFQYPSAQLPDQQPLPGGPGGPITMRSNDDIRSSAPMPMPGPSRGHDGGRDPRPTRRSRRGSPSSSDAMSLSSSSSSSYLDISRWYPSYGRSGGVLNAFFKTPSERQQRVRRRRSLKKKNRGIFAFGNNSSSSSVNSDMAYGMGFVKKPKSRTLSPHRERAATLERLEGRPAQAQRRQTDEEILEIGRKLAKVARDSNREDLRAMGGKRPSSQFSAAQETWDKYSRHNSGGYAASSRGIALSKNGRQSSSSSSDDEWESASEGEYSSDESNSGLAYGAAVDLGRSSPPKSTVSRQSTHISARPPEDIRPPDRKSSAVDPRLFGPVNSLRGLINTPCGHGDRNSAYTVPGPSEQRYAGSAGTAESASIEARPMQTVYPIQTSDPSRVDAARGSGSLVSSHPSFSALSREPSHSSRRPEPLPIQAPKPIAPVPNSMYDEQRIRDSEQRSPRESRIKPNENKTFAETALVGAGVAALGAAIMAGRDKGKGKEKMKERDPERRQERHERYGHDDHRDEDTVVQDSRRAKELALEKEIERLERALSDRNKAREQRRRDSKRDSMPELSGSREADADAERDHEKRRRDRDSRYSEPDYSYGRPETSRRVSDDAFRTRDSPLRAASPVIIDVTPAPSPPLEEDHRKSRRESFEDELRDAKHIYDESMHSTAPISAVDMAAAIAATERARHRDEPERGRTLTKTQDIIQEEANAYYHARRMAEREVSSRSRSKSDERSIIEKYDKDRDNESQGAKIVRIVTPPEMKQKPQKHKYSEPNADFRFDNLMSPKDFDYFRPHEYLVRDPSAERPRPLLNLVIPTPVPTPTPDSQKKKSASSKSPEPVVEVSEREVPDVVTTSKGEVVEAQQTPTSKRVSWEPSETQQYDAESPDWSSERNSRSYERPRSSSQSSGWGATAAAVAGIAAAAALSKDDEPESSGRDSRARDSTGSKSSEGSRSPPSRKILPKGTAPSRVLEEEPDDVPPAPGPKPASPRSSQMPGAFADDLDFAATLAAGLQDTGFDPNIVIEDATYRRRDSPPGSNEHTGVYMQPFSETVTDLGVNDIDDGARPSRGSGYVIGELADTPASEKGSSTFDWAEGSERRQSKSEKRRSAGSGSFEAVQGPEEESPKLSKKEQRKIEKAARAAKLAEEEDRSSRPAEAAEDDWEDASTSRRSKRSSKKSKRTSVAWDDADMPVNDRRVSVPVDAFDDLDDTKPGDNAWDKPQRTNKSKRNSKGYDMPDDTSDRRERRREERRRSELYEPLDRDVTSVVSDIGHDDRSNGRDRDRHDDERSVVSAPDGKRDSKSDKRSSKEEKRSSGGFWGLLKGSNGADGEKQSKKDNAGTLGAGAGVAGAVAVASIAAGSLSSRSDAAAAPLDQEETQHIIVDAGQPSERRADIPSRGINVFDFQDPEITPRVIKPAIDPQYGDFLPLPPSPSDEQNLDFDVGDDLPSLPDSRPGTPPGQEKLVREKRDSSQKRPATHSRRRSAYEMPLKSPSHTAIPITFRMGQRSSVPVSPRVVSNPVSAHQSPAVQTPETFSSPSTKRSPRPPSWDRPTSWESTREIKPLYLIERSAHTSGDSAGQEHDDRAENTPLPPSRESNAPDFGDVGGDIEQEARILESAPLFVDTAVARAVPLGSQETTPKGFTQTDSGLPDSAREFGSVPQGTSGPSHIDSGLPHSAKEVDNTLLMEGPHHQSPLLESTYATPTGSPPLRPEARPGIERDESTESSSDFKDALDRLALDEDTDRGQLQDISRGVEVEQPTYTADPSSVDKKDGPGYLSSALSMLPTGLVGVGALLGRGSRNNASASVDEQPSQGTHGDAAKSVHQPGETSAAPEFEARQAIVTPHINTDEQGQAQSAASVGFSRPYTPADTIKGTDISAPSNSPATHMRLEETLPTSNPQEIEDVSSGVKGLEAEQEAFVTDATSVPLPASPLQSLDNYLISSPKLNPEDKETLPETPVEAVEWPEQSTSKKKKGKKGKKKQSSISASSIPLMAEPSAGLSSDVQLDTPTQEDTSAKMIEEPASKTTEEPSFVPQDTTTLSNEPSRQILEPGIEPGFPKGGDQDISSTPYQILGDSEGKGLSDEPQNLPDTIEAPTLPGIVTQVQTQDEKPQTGDRSRRSSSATRRLRSSRSSTLPHGSIGRPGSPDVFHSGDEGLVSPPGAAVSACSPAENENEETRPIGSSRRLSLASLPGSGRGHQPGSGEIVAFDQPGSSFEEPQEFHDFEQSSPKHHQGVQRNVESPLEVVEQRVPSPLTAVGEHTSDQLELHVDPQAKTASAVDPSAFAVAEPLTNDVQRVGSPSVGDLQRPVQPAESSAQEARPSEVQSIVEHILPTSPQIPRVGDVAGLPSESLDESPFVLGSRSFQDPPSAGDEAIQLASEPIVEEQPPEEHPTDVSGGVAQRSELDPAVHDGLQQKVESPPQVSSVEQIEEPSSSISVGEPIQSLPMPSSPTLGGQGPSELERSTFEHVTEPELQEPGPALASTEDDNAFFTQKSKKNKKKRKSSTILGGTFQSSGTTTPAQLESNTQPVEASVEPTVSHKDDVLLRELSTPPKDTLEVEQQPVGNDFSDLQVSSKSMEPEIDSSRLTEPVLPVSDDKSLTESIQTTQPTVLPVLEYVPAEVALSELEKPHLRLQEKLGDVLDEVEIARREAEDELIRDEEAEMSRLQSKKKLKPKEKTRLKQLKANADQRAEEAAILAETSSPTQPKISGAQLSESSIQPQVSGAQLPDSSIQQPVLESQVEEPSLPMTEEPILTNAETGTGSTALKSEVLPSQLISGSEEAVPISKEIVSQPSEDVTPESPQISGTSPTSGHFLPRLDEPIEHGGPQPEMEATEDPEDVARREAEAFLIRDEEAELTRLEGKKKPNKKDKARMKILRSNSERRAQEADAAAQSQNAEQDAVDLDMPVPEVHVSSSSQQQEEDWSREPLTEQTEYVRTDDPQSLGDMIQTSDAISTSTQPPVESSIILPESDFGATSIEESTQVQPQMHDLSLVHAGDSPSEATAGTGSSQLAEILAERSERQIDPESTHLDSTRPGSAQLHIKQLDSAVPEIVEVPQNRDEDIHFNPGSPLDDSQIMKAPQSLPRRDSLPHIEETVTDPIGTPSHENDGGIPENQIEDFSQDRHGSPSLETKDHFDFDATRSLPGQASQVSSQEPVLVSDITEEAPGTDINSPLGEPGQPAVTVTELPEGPESEWSATTKKSKKDKKKKRKGTISEGSGQNSGTATPFFDAKEQSPIGESRGLPETELGSRGEDPLRSSFEPVTVEHSQQPGFSFPLDGHTAKDSSLDGITAPQPLDASVPEQQESSLSLVGSVPAPGTSDDNLVSDLMGDTSVARPLESNVTEPHEVTIEHGQQPVSSLASEETTATQPLDASIPERQESSLSTGGSVQPPGFSDDNIASDLVEDASVARLLESNVAGLREVSPLTEGDARERDKAIAPLIVPEPEPEQVALAEELEFQPVSKKSKKDKKKNRKNTISEDLSLPSGSATPVTTEEPEQSSSLAETALNFESGQPVSERSLPLDMNQEPSKIEETSETRSPVLETTEPAEKLSLPYSTSEEPSTSLPLGDISASIPEPEPEQSVQEEASFFTTKSKKDKKRKKTLPGTITPMDKSGEVSLPGEPSKIQDTSLESTQRLSSPPLPLSEPERIASGDFSEARSMPTELAEVRSPTHLPEEKGQRPIFPLGSKAEDSQVELGQLSRPSRKSDGWGFHAGAIAGAGVGSSVPQSHDIPREQEAVPEDITSGQSPIQSVGPDTLVSRLSLSFADVVETATTSDSKDQEQSQFNDISRDQTQSSLFSIEDRGQSDDIALEPRPSQDDTSHVISAPKESQSQESGSLNLGVGHVGPPSTQFSLEEDIKHEEGLPSDDLVQGLGNTERAFFDHQDTPREEHTTISEPQTQIDDWTQASSSKKKRKKDKKRKNSNIPWSETESSAHTPVTGEPSKTQGAIIDTDERSASLDAGGLGRPRDSLATQPEPLSEFQASETENRVPLGDGKLGEEASFEGESRSGNTEIAKDIVTSPILHSTVGDRDEAFVEARDQAHESPSSRQIQEGHTSGTLRSPVLSPNFDNRNEPLITATPFHEDEVISSRQSHEPSDRQVHGGFTPDTVPASTEDFATPLQLPAAIQELDAQLTPLGGQLLATSTLGEPSHDNTQIGTELSRSLAPELEASSSVTQIPAELADAPAEESLEPAAEDLWGPIPRKLSKKEKRKAKKGSISTSVPDLTTSTAEGDSQQISEEPAPGAFGIPSRQDSPNFEQVDEPVVQEADKMDLRRSLEPENEQTTMPLSEEQPSQAQDISVVDTPILSRKMSKKEKREAKKSSLSAWEDDIVERGEPSQSQTPTTVETQAQDMPTPSSPILRPELEQSEATQISGSAEPRLEQEVSEAGGQTSTHDAAAEDEWAAPISRKKSKKDKKKKGKQSSSGSISGTQTPVIVEAPIQHAAEAVESGEPISERPGTPSQPLDASQTPVAKESPVEHGIDAVQSIGLVPERPGTPSQPTDVSQIESHRYQGPPEIDISSPDNTRGLGPSVHATEDASAFEGRMRHRSAEMYLPLDNTNDGELAGPSEDARKSSRRGDHRSAELYVPGGDPGLEVHRSTPIEDDWDKPSDDQYKNDNKYSSLLPDKTPTLNTPMGRAHNIDKYHDEASKTDAEGTRFLRSPDGRGKELERMRPSPDLWDNEDYFKPKPANYVEPDQEAFSKFDIHPAVARGLNTSPDKRGAEERPLVGLGLIHRHSSIFQEDEGHVPKLLTMTSDNVSTDSIAVQEVEAGPSGESSQLGGWTRSATVPEPPDSSRSYDEGLNPAVKQVNTKQWFTFETGPAHGANVPLARSVSPDSLRPVSPGLPRSPQFPPPRSPQLSAQPSPRSPHFPPPSPRSPHYSPRDSTSFEAARDPTKKVGSVAALAEKFGGGKKATGKTGTISDYFDNRNPRDDDFFDEPAMWEDAEHKPLRVSRLDVDSGDHWAVHHTKLEGEQPDPDMHHSGQEAAATSHGREPTTPGSDNVSEPCSQPDIDAGTFTPQIPDQASREAEIPLEYVVVESPVLGSQTSVEFPTDERKPQVKSLRELPDAAPFPPENTEDAALHEFLYQPHDSSTTHSRSPALKISSPGEVTPSIEARDETEPAAGQSIGGRVDYGHPLSIGLPPVQEEPHEEEAEVNERALLAGPRAVTPDANRDSGVVTGSPVPPRVHKFEIAEQQRDSGVHMREPSGASPRLLGARAFSPQPARLSHSSIEDGGGDHDDKSSKMSSAGESEAQRRFKEATPVLEAQDVPVTPEPRKSRSKVRKYPDLGPSPGKKAVAAALAGGGALLAADTARSRTPSPSPSPAASQRSVSDVTDELRASALPRQRRAASSNAGISRTRTPEPLSLRAESPSLLRHSGTPPLRSRRTRSGDLRSLSQLSNRSHSDLGAQTSSSPASAVSAANKGPTAHPSSATPTPTPASSDLRRATTPAAAIAQGTNNPPPTANEGRVRSKDMADVYDGVGEGRLGSPRSPTRPHSMRRRQSMQVLELESRVEQLAAENRALQDARAQAEAYTTNRATSTLAERDTEIEALKQTLNFMRKEVQRLTEVNQGLNSAIQQHAVQHDDRYRLLENQHELLESQHAEVTRELLEHRGRDGSYTSALEIKDQEIKSLREQLEATKEQIREMQKQILDTKPADSDFLRIKDVDYFDHRCQQLCSHVQQWVLRFSKFSDMRACRLTSQLNDEKIIDRLDNAVLDGSNVDHYLNDRVRRRDVFMSVTMTMIWEFVFTRYLFGMDREQRQKLKNLEKLLLEVGPPHAVRQWRAVTLTLLSRREPFKDQRDQDTEAVVQAVFQTLSMILPPPSNLEDQIQGQLRKVMREAVDLSVEMRTQRAEYMMLPPLQPEYDANGDLAEPHPFNSALMNERSGDKNAATDNDELEAQGAVVRVVLFPLVVKKGDDEGMGDDEVVVCPAQVIVARPRSKSRHSHRAPSSDAGGVSLLRAGSPSTAPNRSNVSMADAPGVAPGMEGAI